MKGVQKSTGLDEWIAEASAGQRCSYRAAWKSWPPAVLAELAEVLRRNDAGTAQVTERAMRERINNVHGIAATKHQLAGAVEAHLGRRSWSTK